MVAGFSQSPDAHEPHIWLKYAHFSVTSWLSHHVQSPAAATSHVVPSPSVHEPSALRSRLASTQYTATAMTSEYFRRSRSQSRSATLSTRARCQPGPCASHVSTAWLKVACSL